MDFGWFTTIPGMLITGGVLLLIIALIIFISTSSKKGKKGESDISQKSIEQANQIFTNQPPLDQTVAVDVNNSQMNTTVPEMDSMAAQNSNLQDIPVPVEVETTVSQSSGIQEPTVPVQGVTPIDNNGMTSEINNGINTEQYQEQGPIQSVAAASTPVDPIPSAPVEVTPQVDNVVVPVDNNMKDQAVQSIQTPVAQVNDVVSSVVETPAVVGNSVENVVPVEAVPIQNATPIVESNPAPVNVSSVSPVEATPAVVVMPTEAPVQNDIPAVQVAVEQQSVATPVSIYGGASPIVNKSEIREEEKHEIYGGANPLDNTQPISINDIKSVEQHVVETPQVVPIDQSGINS